MESIDQIILNKQLTKEKKISERAELIKFWLDNLKDKKGKPYKPARIAMLLAHLSLSDLYAFKSQCNDRLTRNGQESFQKYFWYSIKVDKNTTHNSNIIRIDTK